MVRLLVLVVGLGAVAVVQQTPPKPDAAAIEQAIRQLGDRRFAVREQATKLLWEAGAAAEPGLRQALTSGDAETVNRARGLLDKFDWGIYPDTPAAVLQQIEDYRGGDEVAKSHAIEELVRLGKPGFAVLPKLAARAETAEARQTLGRALAQTVARVVPNMLLERDDATAEALLETGLVGEVEEAAANYVSFVLLRGKLDAAIDRWEAEAKAKPSARAEEVLVALYRAKGDLANARKHAAGAKPEVLDLLLWEQGDWTELARRSEGKHRISPVAALGTRAIYHRLAGDSKAAEADIQALTKTENTPEDLTVVQALLLNERPNAALERLGNNPQYRVVVLDLLASQLRFKEALALIDRPAEGEGRLDLILTLQQAKVLYTIGDKDRAGQLFAKLAAGFGAAGDAFEASELIHTEMQLALKDAARDHAAGYLASLSRQIVEERVDVTEQVLESAFPKRGAAARVWWVFLRQKFPNENELATMKRLRDLLEPPAGAAGPGALADAFLAALPEGPPATVARSRIALATAYEAAGQFDAAREQLAAAAEHSGETATGLKLGDFLRERRQFAAAAEAYEKVWKQDKTRALPLYLYGWSLVQAGRAAEGKALLDQAQALPLGDLVGRSLLAEDLARRDLPELARREREMVTRLGWGRFWLDGNVLSYLLDSAREATARQDFTRAADAYERLVASVLTEAGGFRDTSAYLYVASLARANRARAALAAEKFDEAIAHAQKGLDLIPGNVDLAIQLVPELERRGRKADADALYARVVAVHDGLCRDYSAGAQFHNDRAWLAACCHRDLDIALEQARKTTELEPRNASYRDTLAEVHFQRGDKAKAIELIRECMKAEPQRVYFAKQLRRFEAGDPNVPPPVDDGPAG